MPKQTREKLFNNALATFLADFEVTDGINNNRCIITKYELTCKTVNKSGCVQDYELKIPNKIVLGYQDIYTVNDETNDIWEDSQPIYGVQDVPTIHQFIESFDKYFKQFRLYINNRVNSYIYISNLCESKDNSMDNEILKLRVIYHKSHTPFPRPLTELEEKNKEIDRLTELVDEYEENMDDLTHRFSIVQKKLYKLKKENENKIERNTINYQRTQKVWREMYTKLNEFQPCPVCYETIEPDTLIVPNCTHMICDTCVRKCDKCPLCRDNYDEFIEID